MTLSVSAFYREQDGSRVDLPLQSDLAGFERMRADFYGSHQAQKLGLKLLPTLKDTAVLQVCGSELSAILSEVVAIWESLPSGHDGEYWRFRLNNIKMAIRLASEHGEAGCVEIA